MDSIVIHINGELTKVAPSKLTDLLRNIPIKSPYFAIALNDEVIPSAEYDNTAVRHGDFIEIIQPVCGG